VVSSAGSVVNHIVYDPYGNIVSQTNSEYQPRLAFDGMQLDTATGLYYDNARYYDSSTGRFISQDPLGFAGGTSDLYQYVLNNPVDLTDPTGLVFLTTHQGTSANETAGGIALSVGILVTGPALVIAGAAVTAPTLVAVAAAGTEEGAEAASIVEGTAQAEAEAEAEASANAEDSPPEEEDPEECDSENPGGGQCFVAGTKVLVGMEQPQGIQVAGTIAGSHPNWFSHSRILGALIVLAGPAGVILAGEFKRTKKAFSGEIGEETVAGSTPRPQT
jgi:RHS repeat-associated protein